ncbi:DUF1127 domain-containing protein [Malonomonas rubra]
MRIIEKLSNQITIWREISAQRRKLGELSDYHLKDIGLSRVDA